MRRASRSCRTTFGATARSGIAGPSTTSLTASEAGSSSPGDETWGIWDIPESSASTSFLTTLTGLDTIELGCGTGYISAWLARRGARPVGIDNSEAQLATARRLQAEHGIEFPLIFGNAEAVPLPDASFDLAISEYGASIWADPYRWVPEAARLLRPGGRLVFLVNGLMLTLCSPDAEEPATDRLLRPYFGLHRLEWSADNSVNFCLGYGDWIRLLRSSGFDVEDLVELRPRRGRDHGLPVRDPGMGPPVAERRGLEGPQAGLTAPIRPRRPARTSGRRIVVSLAFLGGLRGLGWRIHTARAPSRIRVAARIAVSVLLSIGTLPQAELRLRAAPRRPRRPRFRARLSPTRRRGCDAPMSSWTGGSNSRVIRPRASLAIRRGPRTRSTIATGNSSIHSLRFVWDLFEAWRITGDEPTATEASILAPRLGARQPAWRGALGLLVERPFDGDPDLRPCLRRGRRAEGRLDPRGIADPCGDLAPTPGSTSVTATTR